MHSLTRTQAANLVLAFAATAVLMTTDVAAQTAAPSPNYPGTATAAPSPNYPGTSTPAQAPSDPAAQAVAQALAPAPAAPEASSPPSPDQQAIQTAAAPAPGSAEEKVKKFSDKLNKIRGFLETLKGAAQQTQPSVK